ncbi:MAG: glycogen-binding domain-containing protein [Verrucomicrobiae bacterium]|nr:glycogen-binding domain-containing protein [Verrucomicrobiae bacterium]
MKHAGWAMALLLRATTAGAVLVSFQYHDPAAKQVALAGEFNRWQQWPMLRDVQGTWHLVVDLEPGRYGYKFVINGHQWVLDPATPHRKIVGDIENSAVDVSAPRPATPVPRAGETLVTFVYTNATAQRVVVAGSFNRWSQTANPLARDADGVWRTSVALPAGRYYDYKFVVDGNWVADPGNTEVVHDGQGNWNSVMLAPRGDEPDPVYLPNVWYHDRAQRTFVVELARVLAWRHNCNAKQPIAEITYEATTQPTGLTEWRVQWRDASGRALRERVVSYSESALRGGAQFYRDVFATMAGDDWRIAPSATTNDVEAAFWRGADAAGRTRISALRAAKQHLPRQAELPESVWAGELAGLLSHAAIHSVAGGYTLDGLLLSRAAAWLCVAEAAAGVPLDPAWIPVVFLAGRVPDAERMAAKMETSTQSAGTRAWWRLMVTRPTMRQACEFALQPEHRKRALPFLAYLAQLDGDVVSLSRFAARLVCEREEDFVEMYDYAPLFWRRADVGAAHLSHGYWPAFGRQDWVRLLTEWEPLVGEDTAYQPEARQAWDELQTPKAPTLWRFKYKDAAVDGWEPVLPLLRRAESAGWGAKRPVAVASAEELLQYGWELTAVQLGARHYVLKELFGLTDESAALVETATNALPGLQLVFDLRAERVEQRDFSQSRRWESVDALDSMPDLRAYYMTCAVRDWPRHENLMEFARRNWLRPNLTCTYIVLVSSGQHGRDVEKLVHRLVEEGGPLFAALAHGCLVSNPVLDAAKRDRLLDWTAARAVGAERLQRIRALPAWGTRPALEHAQELERIYWLKPGQSGYRDVFGAYLDAHAYRAAKRFYAQAREVVSNRVGFDTMAAQRYALAWLEQDEAGMREALRDGATGSARDFIMQACHAAVEGRWDDLREIVEQGEERYEEFRRRGSSWQRLKGFLPLLPALADPNHPERAKALDYFLHDRDWPTLQWIMIKKFGLGVEDAVRFLGGRTTHPERRVLVFYLLGEKEEFQRVFEELDKKKGWPAMGYVLGRFLRNQWFNVPVPDNQPDLRPADAVSLEQFMMFWLSHQATQPLPGFSPNDM